MASTGDACGGWSEGVGGVGAYLMFGHVGFEIWESGSCFLGNGLALTALSCLGLYS